MIIINFFLYLHIKLMKINKKILILKKNNNNEIIMMFNNNI